MYATVTDMTRRIKSDELIQLTDDAMRGVMDAAAVATALTSAGHLIDSYLAPVYALPLSSIPPVLTDYAVDIARYRLYRDAVPENVQTRYDEAIDWLKLVSTGKVKLDVAGIEPASQPDAILTAPSLIADKRDSLRRF